MNPDTLSEVLSAVSLSGSVFFDVIATSPWVAEAPPAAEVAQEVVPGAQHAMEYHLVTSGSCWISLVGEHASEPLKLQEGDIVVVPHGDPHVVSSAPGLRAAPGPDAYRNRGRDDSPPFILQTGGDGADEARLICGFFGCDTRPFNPLLDSLPRIMRFGRDQSGPHGRLNQFIQFAAVEMASRTPGSQSVLNRLSELMFVEVIRLHIRQLGDENTGWLAGLRDPLIGRALMLLHGRPAHPWTLEGLASELGSSRSVLVARFAHLVGCPPIQYLTQWRMQLAARKLADPGTKISAIAHEVGYDSEAAFSRAFKKFVGRSPGQWRGLQDRAKP